MPRTPTQAWAARKLRRENAWITTNPDAMALAVQLVYLAQEMDAAVKAGDGFAIEPISRAYLDTRTALLALKPAEA